MSENCPKCGSGIELSSACGTTFRCETHLYFGSLEQSELCKTRQISRLTAQLAAEAKRAKGLRALLDETEESKTEMRSKLAAAEARTTGLVAAFSEIKEAAWAAHRDIGEWVQLACRQQQASADYTHDPLCATDAGLSRSQDVRAQLVGALGKVAALLSAGEEAKDAVPDL